MSPYPLGWWENHISLQKVVQNHGFYCVDSKMGPSWEKGAPINALHLGLDPSGMDPVRSGFGPDGVRSGMGPVQVCLTPPNADKPRRDLRSFAHTRRGEESVYKQVVRRVHTHTHTDTHPYM